LALIGDTVPVSKRSKYVGKFMEIVFLGQGFSAGLGSAFSGFVIAKISYQLLWVIFFIFISIFIFVTYKQINNE
jgi:MFS family permease